MHSNISIFNINLPTYGIIVLFDIVFISIIGIIIVILNRLKIKRFLIIEFENSDMKGLYIPDNIENIGAGAFDGCTEMEAVSAMSELLEKTGFEIFDDTNIDQKALADSIAEIKEEQDIADEDNSTEDIEDL